MTQSQRPKRRRITFSLDAPGADGVYLAGDFNSWDHEKHPLKRDPNGIWQKIVMLLPGRYEYRFFVDGHWSNDRQNPETCRNCYGTLNNVIIVEPPPAADSLKRGSLSRKKRKTRRAPPKAKPA